LAREPQHISQTPSGVSKLTGHRQVRERTPVKKISAQSTAGQREVLGLFLKVCPGTYTLRRVSLPASHRLAQAHIRRAEHTWHNPFAQSPGAELVFERNLHAESKRCVCSGSQKETSKQKAP